MAWLRGKVSLGSFPDLAGAVNKISESVKNIEKNFDNALGLEDQPGSSTSTVDASQALSPEFMAFTVQKDGSDKSSEKHESSSHGNVPAKSSKKPEPSEKQESSEKHESSVKDNSSRDPTFSKEIDGIDVKDSTNISEECISSVREASAEISKPEEHHVESLKPEEYQHHPVETNIAISEEVDNNAEKSMDTNTVCEKEDGIVGLPNEAENIAKKPIEADTATSHKATAIADNHIKAEADSQAKPNSDDAEESSESLDHAQHSENSEIGSNKNPGSREDQLTNPADQVANSFPELQKSGYELNIRDTVTTQKDSVVEEVDATYDGQSAVDSEPNEVTEIIQEVQPSLLPSSDNAFEKVPEVVSKDDNGNDRVHTLNQLAGDDHRDEKVQHNVSGSILCHNTDVTVEVETLKSEMNKMEAALLGAARQAQAKADEISKLMNENEQLKSIIEDQRGL